MTEIRLTNTKTRRKEDFVPIDPQNVRMYVCGPTVYDRAHLGNARPVIVFDVLFRLLRHVAKEKGWGKVTYIRNFTDVDDKINAEALRRKAAGDPRSLEELIRERTEETIGWYHADMDALGALRPTLEPRATDFIGEMIAMIADLIARGHAYEKEGHVLFRVRSYEGYGKLSGRSVDDMIAGARVEVAPFKEDPMDFVLWKPSTPDLPGWESPWGRGRPGWHIECSAMSDELLGDSFDIHGGGIDLQFPHHENEIAQSKCAHPEADFARVWMHNEMLQVEGKKMSKSLGNFFTVRDLLDKGIPGEVIRFVFLSTHYSKPMDWTEEKAKAAEATLNKWSGLVYNVKVADKPSQQVVDAISDDLNTALAIAVLHALADRGELGLLASSAQFLGLDISTPKVAGALSSEVSSMVSYLLKARRAARAARDFAKADAIRAGLKDAGIRVEDGPSGPEWFVARDEIDSAPYFHAVRSAYSRDDNNALEEALRRANAAGISFRGNQPLDVAPAWRGLPTETHIRSSLAKLLNALEALK
jgi:cysteinyl-tRNA synthetase